MKKFLSDSVLTRFKNEVGRNTFDRSKKHFASYNLGKIYPIYCQHLQANETVKIRPSEAFDMEPMTHELYNDIKCNTAWFKVYTRSLWSNYRSFSRLDPTKPSSTITHPYIASSADWAKVGSLANHLGIPVATYGVFDGNSSSSFIMASPVSLARFGSGKLPLNYTLWDDYNGTGERHTVSDTLVAGNYQSFVTRDFSKWQIVEGGTPCFQPLSCPRDSNGSFNTIMVGGDKSLKHYLTSPSINTPVPGILLSTGFDTLVSDHLSLRIPHIGNLSTSGGFNVYFYAGSSLSSCIYKLGFYLGYASNPGSLLGKWFVTDSVTATAYPNTSTPNGVSSPLKLSYNKEVINLSFSSNHISQIQSLQQENAFVTCIIIPDPSISSSFASLGSYAGDYSLLNTSDTSYNVIPGVYGVPTYTSQREVNEVSSSPFVGTSPTLPINALPFRAYRNIYNSHFRDLIHDPLRDGNGNIMVDQYVENMGDGADSTTKLDFEYCRFEPDLFNTCLPTPTMGDDVNRPLVGITTSADMSTATLNYHADGKAYSFDVNTHTEGSQNVIDGFASTHSEDNNNLTYLTLKDAIQYGISLQDLQNVRALTKWYQASYAGKGRFSYTKFIEAHFGKEPALNENLAAEYLGGDTVYVNSMRVVNQTSDGPQPLGHTGGMADFRAKNSAISCYADEDCYVMGVVWFTCDNVNSQSIDPMWYMSQPQDYGNPIFADLGVMPILNKVVAPLQCDASKYNDVFGYQRMYGDKIYSFDTVAGDFINLKSDYLMQRRFDAMPTLTADLMKMHPEDFTNIFCFDNSYDKIYGRWYFDITFSTWLQQVPNAQII